MVIQTNATDIYKGLLVLGTSPRCGKTTVTTAITACLIEQGFTVQAYKPLEFFPEMSVYRGQDQAFMDKITQQWSPGESVCAVSADKVNTPLWNRLRERCIALQFPALLEGVGHAGSVWAVGTHLPNPRGWMDSLDIAEEFHFGTVLVVDLNGRYSAQWMDDAHLMVEFLKLRGRTPVGWVGTYPQRDLLEEHIPEVPSNQDELILQFAHGSGVDCLGVMPYSPSINVQKGQQGNCIRLAQEHIDLLPVQMALGLSIKVA